MNRSNYLYLFIGLAFLVLLALSLFNDLNPKVVIGYSFSALIFSLTDLISTTFDNRRKYKELQKDKISEDFDEYISEAKLQTDESIEAMKQSNSDISTVS